jgi:hypothetical protein
MWIADVEPPTQNVFADRAAFNAMVSAHDMLKPTPFLRVGFWRLACIAVCCVSWRRSAPREAAFALGVCGSATVYVSFYAVGVASDFRYAYWAVLASIAGGVVVLSGGAKRAELPVQSGLLLRFSRRGPALVVGVGNARQFLDERRNRPDFVVLGAGLREAGHASHVDAVLDHPEQLGR